MEPASRPGASAAPAFATPPILPPRRHRRYASAYSAPGRLSLSGRASPAGPRESALHSCGEVRAVVRCFAGHPKKDAAIDRQDNCRQCPRPVAPGAPRGRWICAASSPVPRSALQNARCESEGSVQERECPLFALRRVVQPVHHDADIEKPDRIRAQIADAWYFLPLFRLRQDFTQKTQILQPQLLRLQAERTKLGMRLQRTKKHRSHEILIGREVFQLPVNDGEKFFRQWRPLKPRFPAKPFDQVVGFLLEEEKRKVFLGFEVIEESSFGNACLF